jgi:hypothetical protein
MSPRLKPLYPTTTQGKRHQLSHTAELQIGDSQNGFDFALERIKTLVYTPSKLSQPG